MRLLQIFKYLDNLSPYPLFYSFIMSKEEKMIFDKAIKKSKNYLEFGMGGSTLHTIKKSKATIYTVESSPQWIRYMQRYLIIKFHKNRRLFIFPIDIGSTQAWGFPKADNNRHLFPAYSSEIFKKINTANIDLILIDGRFRVACTLKSILECCYNDNLKILIHDFWNREQYHTVLKYLDTIERIDTIGLFTIKSNIDLESVRTEYEIYKFNPA